MVQKLEKIFKNLSANFVVRLFKGFAGKILISVNLAVMTEIIWIITGVVAGIRLLSMVVIGCIHQCRRSKNPNGINFAKNYFKQRINDPLPLETVQNLNTNPEA